MARKPPKDGGGRFGLDWKNMTVGKRVIYPGTYNGAKAQVWRANQAHAPSRYTSMKGRSGKAVYVLRLE